MNKEVFLTKSGIEKLQEELEELKSNGRKEVAERLRQAREFGDLSENSEYSEAKDHQAFLEGRIAEIEAILKNVTEIEDEKVSHDKVGIGSTVHVELEDGTQKFTIVGPIEADPMEGKISHESPIGQALIGKKVGDEVNVDVPAGTMRYKIKTIE